MTAADEILGAVKKGRRVEDEKEGEGGEKIKKKNRRKEKRK